MMTVNLEDREKKRKKGRKKERGGSGDVGKKERRKEGREKEKEVYVSDHFGRGGNH